MDGDGKFPELAGGDEAPSGGKESGEFEDKGGKDIGALDDRGKGVGAFDGDGRGEETAVSNDGGVEEVVVLDKGRGKGTGDEGGVSDDAGGEEAGVSDEGGAEEVGAADERGGKEMGLFDEIGGAGVPDEDVNEVGVWGCEDGSAIGTTSADARCAIHRPKMSTPRGHVAVGGEEVEGDEGGWDD